MARNWIQFQKGYRLTQFVDEYGTVEQCMGALFRWRCPRHPGAVMDPRRNPGEVWTVRLGTASVGT